MWLVKNRKSTPENLELVQTATAPSGNLADADFSLRETDAIDFEKMAAYGIPMIVDYGVDTCIPCKEIAPVLEAFFLFFEC